MLPHEYEANSLLNERIKANRKRWYKDWGEGLAHCNECDYDYTDLEAVMIDDESSCPNCKKPEHKTYYYCSEHGAPGCKYCDA